MKPESKIRDVVDLCADCDICRYLMEATCHFFPELYRLFDREVKTGDKITAAELRRLVDLCNFCAVCPCPNIRADIMAAKTAFIDRDGLKMGVRIIEDVERVGRWCGTYPRLANLLLQNEQICGMLKTTLGIHKKRSIPRFPEESFSQWANRQNLNAESRQKQKRKAAYFSGCTARHFFPDVAKATVEVLRYNGIEVFCPDRLCCGMPTMLEGDRRLTLKFAGHTVKQLAAIVEDGYDIVCSCPTCGFMLKNVLKEGAYYSSEYQKAAGADEHHLKIPGGNRANNPGKESFVLLKKSVYPGIFKDAGYFSSISAQKRIVVAENTYDLGEYLKKLLAAGALKQTFGSLSEQAVYYPPCHLREQNVGRPYQDVLSRIPGMSLESIKESFYCCGMGGIMGFKKGFHSASVKMGGRLMAKIKKIDPQRLVTDCLSCRLQFNHLTPYPVVHPIEILRESYAAYQSQKR